MSGREDRADRSGPFWHIGFEVSAGVEGWTWGCTGSLQQAEGLGKLGVGCTRNPLWGLLVESHRQEPGRAREGEQQWLLGAPPASTILRALCRATPCPRRG